MYQFFFKSLVEFTCEVGWSCSFKFLGSFLITDSILFLLISLFKFSVSSRFGPKWLYVSRNLYIIYVGIWFFIVFFYDPLYFCGISCNFFFTSDFIYLGSLSFLNDESGLRVINFVLFKEASPSFTDLYYCLLISISFISTLIFLYPSFD